MWWLRRSIRTTSASACRSACAAASPAKPPPMITTRLRFAGAASGRGNVSRGRVSSKAAVIRSPFASCVASARDRKARRPLAGAGSRFGRGRRFLSLGAQLEQPEQDLVALRLQLGDRARADLGMNAVDELLLHFGRQYWLPKNLPPGRHRAGELLEEVLDAAWAAAEVVEQHVAHDAPTQARSPAQRGVDVGSADDAFGNEVVDLPRQCRLQAIGHMPGHFLAQPDGLLPQAYVELRGALNG